MVAIVGVAGGVTLAAFAGSIRTREALPDFIAYNRAPDAAVFVDPSLPAARQERLIHQVLALPEWDGVAHIAAAVVSVRQEGGAYSVIVADAVREADFPLELSRPIVVDGQQPDPTSPTDAIVNEAFADSSGLGVGDTFDLRSITSSQLEAAGNGRLRSDPDGTDFTMTVAAIVRQPSDLRTTLQGTDGGAFGQDAWKITLMPAWWDAVDGDVASYGGGALGHLAEGVTRDELTAAVTAIDSESFFIEPNEGDAQVVASVQRATDFEATALLIFAAVVALASVVLVGQAIGRQVTLRLDDNPALRAAGLSRRQRAAVALPRTLLLAAVGVITAMGVAVAASPLSPVGLARQAELDPGVDVDVAALLLGGAAIAILIILWSGLVAWRTAAVSDPQARHRDRPSVAGAWLAASGASVTTVAGVRLALERGRGRTAVPVVSTVLAGIAGVFMVTAVLTFSLSLTRLVDSPQLQGWAWDVTVGNFAQQDTVDEAEAQLRDNPLVGGYLGENSQALNIDGQSSTVASIGPGDPTVGPPVIAGRRPDAGDEIALGRSTLVDLGKEIGDTVTLTADSGGDPVEATIVGTVVLPASINDSLTLGDGGLMTLDGLRAVYGPQGDNAVAQTFLVSFADGADPHDALASVRADFGDTVIGPNAPDDIKNLGRVQGLPLLLAATVSLLALGTLANTLITCIRRRRRDLATFATLGFRPRQIAGTVAWQATTIAIIALVVGLPLGLAAGRTVWALIMESIGTSVPAVTPWVGLGLSALVVLVGANVIAAIPARAAARTRPATTLRSE